MPSGPFAKHGPHADADLRLRSSASCPSLPVQLAAKRKADEIDSILQKPIGVDDERRIIALLRGAGELELDTILWRLDIAHLLGSIYDYGSSRHRSELVELLSRERLPGLSMANRTRLVGVLHTGASHRVDERAIADIFLGTNGPMLTELKNAVDCEPESADLHQLIFQDLHDATIRATILEHIAKSAPGRGEDLKLLSDVDDTVLAWRDRRFPKKTTYPGVVEFYRALCTRSHLNVQRRSDLVFITARPADGLGAVEGLTLRALHQCGLHGIVLTGDLAALRRHDLMAEKKYESFTQYLRLYPESCMVFIGDNGQGDMILAQRLLAEHRDAVVAAFIHDVDHDDRSSDRDRAAHRANGIVLFDTYVGAAAEAFEQGLIDRHRLAAIARAAEFELGNLQFGDAASATEASRLLARDLAYADRLSRAR